LPPVSAADARVLLAEDGIPRWGDDLHKDTLAQESGQMHAASRRSWIACAVTPTAGQPAWRAVPGAGVGGFAARVMG
jgi:hypothetical protein